MVRPEDLEIIIFGEEKTLTQFVEYSPPPRTISKIIDPVFTEEKPIDQPKTFSYTDEWKSLDTKAGIIYTDRAKISNSLINLDSQDQRAIAYKQIVSLTNEYNQIQNKKASLERGETIELVKEAKEKDYSGYSGLQLHKEIENLRQKRSKRKKSLDSQDVSPKYRQKYERQIKFYTETIDKLLQLKDA